MDNIRSIAQSFGSIKLFKAYLEVPLSRPLPLLSELQSSGVSLTDCPHNGRKDVADKMIIGTYVLNINPSHSLNTNSSVDMLAHAIDNPAPSTIVLISGDRDFAYALSILRLRRYHIVLITLSNAHQSLKAQASLCFNWISDVSGTVDPTSVLHQPTSPLRGKTSIPATHGRFHSDIKNYNLSRFPFEEPYDEKPADSVELSNYIQDKTKYGDMYLTSLKRDSSPDFSPPESEPSKRPPAASMASANGPGSPGRIIYSPAHLNDSIETPLIMTETEAETSHDSNSSQSLPSSGGNSPKLSPHGAIITSGFHTLRGSTSLPNLVLEHEIATNSITEPVSWQQTQMIFPAEPDLRGGFSPSPQQQSMYSTKSYSILDDSQVYDPDLDSVPDSSPASPTNVATSLPTSSFTPPSSLNRVTTTIPNTAQNSKKKKKGKTTNPTPPPPVVPDKFKILVQCLKSHRSKGILRPLRTKIAVEIGCNGTTYRQAGVTKFRDYAAIAEKEGIISLGGWQGTAWISLLEPWV